jgi:hypothetical protein
MSKRNVAALLCIFVFLIPSWSESSSNGGGSDQVFEIREVRYSIDGKTREDVLRRYLDIRPGQVLEGRAALQEYLEDKRQMIDNQRTLEGGDVAADFFQDPEDPRKTFVDIEVSVKDTWNYIALPYAKYDSNEGFLMSLRGRNYNFLGGMETLEINLDYVKVFEGTEEYDTKYSLNGGFAIPFYLWDYDWKFSIDEDIAVIDYPDEKLLQNETHLGLSMDIPLDRNTWQAKLDQYYYLNPDGREDPDAYYMRTSGSFGSSIPLGLDVPFYGIPDYSVALITSYSYKPFGTLSEDRQGYEFGAAHGLSVGRINWLGNFRDGTEVSLDQDLRYNFSRELWLSNFDLEFQGHKSFGWGALSSRVQAFYRYNDVEEDAGEPIRGILNSRMSGDAGVFVNLDFPVKMWIWFLDRWFEGHISPFFDYALLRPEKGSFDLSQGWYGGGLEGFAFLKKARSIYLRVMVGLDLEALVDGAMPGDPSPRDGGQVYEIYIGLGHHY